jgi:hypothetical protein
MKTSSSRVIQKELGYKLEIFKCMLGGHEAGPAYVPDAI